jgi:hypothetical protein
MKMPVGRAHIISQTKEEKGSETKQEVS